MLNVNLTTQFQLVLRLKTRGSIRNKEEHETKI